jgi:hypothetical protein
MLACSIEVATFFCGFICSFCFHSCIFESFRERHWKSAVSEANTAFYHGLPVFSVGYPLCILVNTDIARNSTLENIVPIPFLVEHPVVAAAIIILPPSIDNTLPNDTSNEGQVEDAECEQNQVGAYISLQRQSVDSGQYLIPEQSPVLPDPPPQMMSGAEHESQLNQIHQDAIIPQATGSTDSSQQPSRGCCC